MPELWRTVAECDRYEVSSLGNVRHKQRRQPLKPWLVGRGYQVVNLGHRSRHYVHQLVCAAWHGPRPEGMFACHRNDIATDNTPENLYWGTRVDNRADAKGNGCYPSGESHPTSKLTAEKVIAMRKLREETGLSYAKIAKQYGVDAVTAFQACKRQTWRHIA